MDGTALTMTSRERPHLLLSATGQPRLFVTGVNDGGNGDHTYTLAIRVNSGDSDGGGGSD